MAATCQERGITHVKDIFHKTKPKDNTGGAESFFFGLNMSSSTSSNTNTNSRPGGFMLRSGKNKDVNIMEVPVPTSKPTPLESPHDGRSNGKDTYLSPRRTSSSSSQSNRPLPPPISAPPPPPPTGRQNSRTSTSSGPHTPAGPPSFSPPPPPPSFSTRPPSISAFPPPTPPPPPPPPDYSPTLPRGPKFSSSFPPPPSPVKLQSQRPVSPAYTHVITADVHTDSRQQFGDFNRSPSGSEHISKAGSLFNGDDDGDILNNVDTSVFNDSASSEHYNNNNYKVNNSPLFKKSSDTNKSSDINGHKRNTSLTDTESSLLTATSSGYHSELGSESDRLGSPVKSQSGVGGSLTSSCEEDEFTMDFDDDGFEEGKHKRIYHEYQGEDFSKYLQDDDYQVSTTTLARRVQRHKQQQQQHISREPQQNRRYVTQRKPGLKERITQAFTLTKSDKRNYVGVPQTENKAKIHNFSFMNSKMGMYASEEELREYMTKDLETKSDIGGVRKSAEVPSWYKDTLSASTLRRNKNVYDSSLSTSTPNLTAAEKYKGLQNGKENNRYRGESLSEFGAEVKHKKKVNRFKFWKGLGKKGKKNKDNTSQFENEQFTDIRL